MRDPTGKEAPALRTRDPGRSKDQGRTKHRGPWTDQAPRPKYQGLSIRPVQRSHQHHQIENADVAVEIEGALDLRQVVGADEGLLVDQQRGDDGDAGEVDGAERGDEGERDEAGDGD